MADEKGSALVIAMMVLLVLSVLGATLGTITVGSYRLADTSQNSNSAYYIAEAGANMAYEEIKEQVEQTYSDIQERNLFFLEVEKMISRVNNNGTYEVFELQNNNKPFAEVTVQSINGTNNPQQYLIVSTGVINNQKRTVEKEFHVAWQEKDEGIGTPIIPLDKSIIVHNSINFNGGTISGDIYLDTSNEKSFHLGDDEDFNGEKIFTSYPFKDPGDLYTAPSWRINNPDPKYINMTKNTKYFDEDISWTDYIQLVEDIEYLNPNNHPYYKDEMITNNKILINHYLANNHILNFENTTYKADQLVINSDWNLKIRTNNKEVNLIVNELNMDQGNIEIIDDGTLNLYVLNKLSYDGGSKINQNGSSKQFNLFYGGSQSLTIGGAQYINGGVHIDQADLILTGSGNLNGPILSNGTNVSINGGSINDILLFAPKANVTVDGGGQIEGIVVADQLKLDGGASIEFKKYDFDDFPFGSDTEGSLDENLDDLISSQPAIESD